MGALLYSAWRSPPRPMFSPYVPKTVDTDRGASLGRTLTLPDTILNKVTADQSSCKEVVLRRLCRLDASLPAQAKSSWRYFGRCSFCRLREATHNVARCCCHHSNPSDSRASRASVLLTARAVPAAQVAAIASEVRDLPETNRGEPTRLAKPSETCSTLLTQRTVSLAGLLACAAWLEAS